MKVQEIVTKAMSGEISWLAAADILGMSPRSVRRWKFRLERDGYSGLLDRRRRTPSPRRAPTAQVELVLRLYRTKYAGFNVRHFHQMVVERHGVKLSYSYVKTALQTAGLVKKRRARGRHRLRREPRACFGEMLHIDGSRHAWLSLRPDDKQTLIAIVDDASSRLLYAQLVESESTHSVMVALGEVLKKYGLPMALYSDRASWAAYTPKAGEAVDKTCRTQVGRALDRLGIEQILAYSPQARGRSERVNATLQDRLVSELRLEKIRSVEPANRYIREHFMPDHNKRFARAPREPESAFVALGVTDLEQILCREETRIVGRDNTVVFGSVRLQIEKQRGRASCAERKVVVREHLDGSHSVWLGGQRVGLYSAQGRAICMNTKATSTRKAA